jgi:hypothetical protein
MKIIHYAYEADLHCVGCTVARFGQYNPGGDCDENGLKYSNQDDEGNAINPVFETDEGTPWLAVCGTCGGKL